MLVLGEQERREETGVHALPRLQTAEAPSREGCVLLVGILAVLLYSRCWRMLLLLLLLMLMLGSCVPVQHTRQGSPSFHFPRSATKSPLLCTGVANRSAAHSRETLITLLSRVVLGRCLGRGSGARPQRGGERHDSSGPTCAGSMSSECMEKEGLISSSRAFLA